MLSFVHDEHDEVVPSQWLDIIDLGCGAGAMGKFLRSVANRLVGLDVSHEALALARDSYDEVILGDVEVTTLSIASRSMDVVVASDVLPYLGELDAFFRESARIVRPRGLVAVSVESLADDVRLGYELRFTGRFAHTRAHVVDVATRSGLVLLSESSVTGEPISPEIRSALPANRMHPQRATAKTFLFRSEGHLRVWKW